MEEGSSTEPEPARNSERFSIKRNAVSVTCTIPIEGGEDDMFQGTLEDISSSGLRFSCTYPLEKGAQVEFAFDLEGRIQIREGEIMWVRSLGTLYKAGARFVSVGADGVGLEIKEGVHFSCSYKLNASHGAEAQVIDISDSTITFSSEEILSLGTMVEIVIDPWIDRSGGVFDISFVDIYSVCDDWKVWDLHKVAMVTKAKQIRPGECHIQANFVADKRK